jgi:hypothetical protein
VPCTLPSPPVGHSDTVWMELREAEGARVRCKDSPPVEDSQWKELGTQLVLSLEIPGYRGPVLLVIILKVNAHFSGLPSQPCR